MNRKFPILVMFLILLISLSSLSFISAANNTTDNLKTIKVDNVSFSLPHQYQVGYLRNTSYVVGNMFEFGILSLDSEKDLGSNLVDELYYSNLNGYEYQNINGHYAFVTHTYKSSVKHNVTSVFFNTGDKLFLLSFSGNNITPTIEDIISSTPKSNMSLEEFESTINSTYSEYAENEEIANQEYENEKFNEIYESSHRHHRFNLIWII